MQHLNSIQRYAGFTLLELMIAITVFSIISTITYSGLKIVLDTEQQTSEHINRLSKLQICLSLIQRDIEQAVTREVRNEFGDTLATMIGGENLDLFLEFTRGGYPNPMQLPRSRLQRVGYQLEDGVLYRISQRSLDRAQEDSSKKSDLIDNIKSIEVIYYDQQMKSHNEWPLSKQYTENEVITPLPKAIDFIIEIENMGRIRRLFRVAEIPVTNT